MTENKHGAAWAQQWIKDEIAKASHSTLTTQAHIDAWRDALESLNYPLTDELSKRTANASIFAAAAYERAGGGEAGTYALRRAFLTAMVDLMHPDLDYLRADPAAAGVARKGGESDGEH